MADEPPVHQAYRCTLCPDVVHGENAQWRHNRILAREEGDNPIHPRVVNPDDDEPAPTNFFVTVEL
jgi:hypothetical protein